MNLSSIFELIERVEIDVKGLQAPSSSDERERLLGDFISGKLAPDKRKLVCGWLRHEPELITRVANAVKERRKAASGE